MCENSEILVESRHQDEVSTCVINGYLLSELLSHTARHTPYPHAIKAAKPHSHSTSLREYTELTITPA